MLLEVKTIFVTLILTSWLMILALTAAYAGKFRDGVGKWTLGPLFISLGNILVLERGVVPVPYYLSIIAANILLAAGNSLAYAAVCESIPRRANPWFYTVRHLSDRA